MSADVERLSRFLRAEAPENVLMPAVDKRPLHRHRDGAWTWADFDSAERSTAVGVLLRTLCVIDVDDAALADDLELRFPVLLDVACARTARGRHYYFSRSALCDELGFFDARSPRIAGVDFKTATSSGTAGFVVAAPSPGKAWLRAPWTHALREIPDDVLREVARPTLDLADADLTFPDGSRVALRRSPWLSHMEALAPLLGPDAGIVEGPLVAGVGVEDAGVFGDLVGVLEGRGRRVPRLLGAEDVRRVRRLADYLGVPARMLRALEPPFGAAYYLADLAGVDRDWAEASVAPAADLADLADLAGLGVGYRPTAPPGDGRWLFSGFPRFPPGTPVLRAGPLELPEFVEDCLRTFPGELVLAGGAAMAAACALSADDPDADYDLFVVTGDDEARAREILEIVAGWADVACVTGCAVTLRVADLVVQVVLRLHSEASDVVRGFDLAPCQVVVDCPGPGLPLRARATRAFLLAVERMAFFVPPAAPAWSTSAAARIFRYYCKGFDVFMPGMRRSALRVEPGRARGCWPSGYVTRGQARRARDGLSAGVSTLFALDRICRESWPARRPTPSDARRVCARLWRGQPSDYTVLDEVHGLLRHALLVVSDLIFPSAKEPAGLERARFRRAHDGPSRPAAPRPEAAFDVAGLRVAMCAAITGY